MNILKLIAKLGIVGMPVWVLWIYIIQSPLNFLDGELPYYLYNKETVNDENGRDYDVVILGDSVANAAYLPNLLGENTVNLALGGTTTVEAYHILENYLDTHEAPKAVFISYYDYHLLREDCFWNRTMYFHLLSFADEIEIMKTVKDYNVPSIQQKDYIWEWLQYRLYYPAKYTPALVSSELNQRYGINKAEYTSACLHAGEYIASLNWESYVPSEPVEYSSFSIGDFFYLYYDRILNLCEKNDIEVHIIQMPYCVNSVYTDDYVSQVFASYDKILEGHSDVTFEWISKDEAGIDENDYLDNHHMNIHGAVKMGLFLKEKYAVLFSDNEPLSSVTRQGIQKYIEEDTDEATIAVWEKRLSDK